MMRWCVVVHEKELRTHSTSKKMDIRKENLVTVASPYDWTPFKDVKVLVPSIKPPQTRTLQPSNWFLSMMLEGLLHVPPLFPDVYASRIAFQTNLLSSIKSTLLHWLSIQFWCCWLCKKCLLQWAGVNGIHHTGRYANRPLLWSLLAMAKCYIGCPVACSMYLVISPAICHQFLLACRAIGCLLPWLLMDDHSWTVRQLFL